MMRLGSVAEGELLADERPYPATAHPCDKGGIHAHHLRFRRTSEADPEDRRLAIHDGARIDGSGPLISWTPVANGGHSTTAGQDVQVISQIYVGQHLQNHVNA